MCGALLLLCRCVTQHRRGVAGKLSLAGMIILGGALAAMIVMKGLQRARVTKHVSWLGLCTCNTIKWGHIPRRWGSGVLKNNNNQSLQILQMLHPLKNWVDFGGVADFGVTQPVCFTVME